MAENKQIFGTGAVRDVTDIRDRVYDGIAFSAAPFDWKKGYDIEKVINYTIPIKNQDNSSSCVGNATAYYVEVLNKVETGFYNAISSKAIYSQIALPGGGAYIRDGCRLIVDWGAVFDGIVTSYEKGNPPSENFMLDLSWKNNFIDIIAKKLAAKEYRKVAGITMEIVAQGIRDNYGVIGGVEGCNNGTWNTLEPKPDKREWGHALFFGRAGIDEKGKYIATPNSWGDRFSGQWQKLREEWFTNEYMFNPWLLLDAPNNSFIPMELQNFIKIMEKGCVIENDPPGRIGIIVGGLLREVLSNRVGNAALYLIENKTSVRRVSKVVFDQLPKGNNF